MAALLPEIQHFQTMLQERRWTEAINCLDEHRDEIDALEPWRKSIFLSFMFGREGTFGPWECDLVLLSKMCQLGAPVEVAPMKQWFGNRLFQRTVVGGVLQGEDDTLTPLKTRALQLLNAQMRRVGVIHRLTRVVVPLTDQTFEDFNFSAGDLAPLSPERMQLLEFIIRVFNVDFNANDLHRAYLNQRIRNPHRVDLIRFLAAEGLISWTVPIYTEARSQSREQWVTRQIEQNPDDERMQAIYRIMSALKLEALVSGRIKRPGQQQSQVVNVPEAVFMNIGSFLRGTKPQPPPPQ